MKSSEDPEFINYELRKKDLYVLKYSLHALMPGHRTDSMDYKGPFDNDIERILNTVDEAAIEQGNKITDIIDPFPHLSDGIIGTVHLNKSYHVLNCILEQEIKAGYSDNIYYFLSIMGRKRQADNLYLILEQEALYPLELKKSNPIIKRYENIEDLRCENYNSISELEEKLKFVATMEKKVWKWI